MKSLYSILSIIIILFCSCEEVVDLNLKQADKKNIIDASITQGSPCIVLLTKSQAFRNNNPYDRISNAIIELTGQNGEKEILKENSREPGLYVSEMIGNVNSKYTLKIQVGDEVYEASATIPEVVYIDRIYIYEIKAGDKSWYSPAIVFQDPPEVDNYYYTMLSVNDRLMKTIYLNDDENRNGLERHRILFFDKEDNDDEDLKTGDRIGVEMQTLDKGMYTFYKSLYSVAEGTNAISNFTGGAYGCFKAYNSSFIDAIVSQDIVESGK